MGRVVATTFETIETLRERLAWQFYGESDTRSCAHSPQPGSKVCNEALCGDRSDSEGPGRQDAAPLAVFVPSQRGYAV